MKLQVATLALADRHYMQFTVHLHDDLAADLVAKGQDVRKYLLDRLTRRLRTAFRDQPPGFLFVVEDRDQDGAPVRIHAHGSIAVPRLPVETAPNRKQAGLRKLIANGRQREAELIAGRMFLRRELAAAAGINSKRPMIAATGRSQSRNVWTRTPMFVTITDKWVNYAFKNVHRFSPELGEDRDAISTALRAQARDVWEVIRNGDRAVVKILGRP